jgi:hypothetical protein
MMKVNVVVSKKPYYQSAYHIRENTNNTNLNP